MEQNKATRIRRKFSDQDKLAALAMVAAGKSKAQVSRELKLAVGVLSAWEKKFSTKVAESTQHTSSSRIADLEEEVKFLQNTLTYLLAKQYRSAHAREARSN